MPKQKVFISSVQKEFAAERIALAQYIREDELLSTFFNNLTFKVTLWRPSTSTDHDTAHDTAHEQIQFLNIEDSAQRLIWFMEGELSRDTIMQKLELNHRTTFRENYLEPAMEQGWIEMTLPDKPQSRNQKYRLTKSGIELQKKLKANVKK